MNNGAGGLVTPAGLTIGADGKLYATTYGNNRVLRYDLTTGAFDSEFISAAGGLNLAYDLKFGPDSTGDDVPELYVAKYAGNQVRRFNGATGAFLDVFTSNGNPAFMKFSDGFLYVSSGFTDHSVRRYNQTTGAIDNSFSASNAAVGDGYLGVEIDESGNVLVARDTSGGSIINKHSGTNGMFLGNFGSLPNNSTALLLISALCSPAPAGLVASYTTDGTAEDSAVTNDGALQNGAFYQQGKSGSAAFSFDGINDYVLIPDKTTDFRSQNFTIEGWFSFALSSVGRPLFSKSCAGKLVCCLL